MWWGARMQLGREPSAVLNSLRAVHRWFIVPVASVQLGRHVVLSPMLPYLRSRAERGGGGLLECVRLSVLNTLRPVRGWFIVPVAHVQLGRLLLLHYRVRHDQRRIAVW